ncbi:glycosyltransferase [Pseudomonas sp. ME-P-057]|jgi:GT2 family glycosyltransferase|uniref:glycosyltransferase n=1 Tax=Pseudomonas sp. ME-P-057 TaxID=3040321 RepID=UPI0025547185|nr:glycosyltransferase [Pseudomonas sp. ME-P-057]
MTAHSLHQQIANPYYIYAPDYRETSSGICVLHYLCHALNISGHEAYVALCDVVNPQLRTPFLTEAIMEQHRRAGRVPIAVYPEVIDGNPLGSAVVVRYILNREGFLNGRDVGAADTDLFFYYAEDFKDSTSQGNMLTLPVIDSQLFCPPDKPTDRTKSYLYLHRYPYDQIDFRLLPEDVELLTFKNPKTLAELAEVFKYAKALYSYEISTICTEAMLCGCPVIYFKGEHIQTLPFTSYIGDLGATLHDEPGGYERARDTVAGVYDIWLDMEVEFWSQFRSFIDLTQHAADDYKLTQQPSIERWLKDRYLTPAQRTIMADHLAQLPRGDVLVVVVDTENDPEALKTTLTSLDAWQSLAARDVAQVVYSPLPCPPDLTFGTQWEAAGETAARINARFEDSDAQWLLVLRAGDVLLPSGITCLEPRLSETQASLIFCDEIHRSGNTLGAAFRPDMNLDFLLSLPVITAGHWLMRRDAFFAAGGFDPALPQALELDLILRVIERNGLPCVEHVAEPLLICETPTLDENPDEVIALGRHLERRGYSEHTIEQGPARHYHLKYGHVDQPLVSIIIPTKDQLHLLQRCVESILEKTRYFHYEIIIVDNNSEAADAVAWLREIEAIGGQKVRVLRYPDAFNFSAINNLAARHANGEYLVLLNNDTAVLQDDWLEALLNHALRPEVGIVGAKLLYPSGNIQHAGVIVGLEGPAAHPFIGLAGDAAGYMQRLLVDQNYSVVTAACLMIRKSVYDEVGGLDEEHLTVSYNDVDLCLKVGAQGYLNVWTPHACLLHEGSVSQKAIDIATFESKLARFSGEQAHMYSKWLPVLAADPAYNRNLSLNNGGFHFDGRSRLSWKPLSWRPLPVVLAHPADSQPSSSRRLAQPFETLQDSGEVDGMISRHLLSEVELQRFGPDVIVLQRRIDAPRLQMMRKIHAFSGAFKVLDIDQYPAGLDLTGQVNGQGVDIKQSLKEALSYVDRLVVPTGGLAELFKGWHADIRVVPTLLPASWSQVAHTQALTQRPRVACLMGAAVGEDSLMVEAIVKALAGEVEWVFMGKAPVALRKYAHETHLNAHTQDAPGMLSALDLDLALLPMTLNAANHCRSNTMALEYGACGVPVITSDVDGLRGALPITRLANDATLWVREIRTRLADREAARQEGAALCAEVRSGWISTPDGARDSLRSWLPE